MKTLFPLKRHALFVSLALTTSYSIHAADNNTVVVTATPEESATSKTQGYTAKTSTGASKTDQPLITTPQSVSVITRQQITDQGAMTVNDALNYTAGAFSNFAGGATRYDTVALRGFHGGDVDNIFIDGLRMMSDGSTFNVLQVDPWFLERIDVIKGPSSALYGQTVPGGLVMETSKRPQFAEEGHFKTYYGNHSTTGVAMDYTNAINDQLAFRLTGIAHQSYSQYENTREEHYAISPSLLWEPDSDTSLLIKAYLQKDPSAGFHGSVPADGSLYKHNGRKLSTGFSDVDPNFDQFKRHEQIYNYDFTHTINDTWSVHSTGSYSHSNVDVDQVYQSGWLGTSDTLNRGYSSERSSLSAAATDNQLIANFNTGPVKHQVVIGAEYHQFKNNHDDAYGSGRSYDPFSGEITGVTTPPSYTHTRNRYYQTGGYLQDSMILDRWHLDLSGRYDRIVSKSEVLGSEKRRQDDHISGRAGLLYAFDNGISPYLSYSQAISPQSLTDINGDLLKPATAEQYEAGIKYQPVGSSDLYTAAVYDLTQKSVASRVPLQSYYTPVGKMHSRGLELEAHNQLTPRLSSIVTYTINHVRIESKDDTNGNTPYITPSSMASAWLNYKFDYGITTGVGVRYIGRQWADNENTLRVPSATLVDASVRMDLGAWRSQWKGAYVQLNAKNLGGRDYVAACYSKSSCYWGAERSVIATVGYDF
ncbi:TonB-dependent siderophore receptor [Rosenbergiella collisarenosi]|uniref:TonB-dependent siderophore receptor n=1 Tax=Rosenbergiella collisarenosi TaxID=1544695 RepID=UPI001BDB33B9|nr:TonB-dependent siderophore receptor [Rosenbergiella collisarenosi]MBT0721762.1 TonB-dependent siderophore receptor [Rosenbergiella collisarenosi]